MLLNTTFEKTPHVIQPILAPDFARPAVLYANRPDDAPGFTKDAPWSFAEDHSVSTNTYLNAFFPHIWANYAEIGDLGLTVIGQGGVSIEIVGVDGNEQEILLSQETFQLHAAKNKTLWLGHEAPKAGRLFFRLTAHESTLIEGLAWVTDVAPKYAPSLSVGLCTFNREAELAVTVSALAKQRLKSPEIKTIWVVNQGQSFENSDILDTLQTPGFELIEQPNLGGCGGFTRSMFEATHAEVETTHHLLMDDDIVLDPRVLDKVLYFLKYADQLLALGGQMLEVENPTLLYEAGGKLHPRLFVTPVAQDTDVGNPKGLSVFSETPEIDYNGWWFCVVPVAAIHKVGLPPPQFIRGDDIEYGCRLSAGGIKNVPLPGCAVWHESFDRKDADWMTYYVFRNRILLTHLHPNVAASRDALFLFGFLMTHILENRYRATAVALKAIQDCQSLKIGQISGQEEHKTMMQYVSHWPKPEIVTSACLGPTDEGIQKPLNTSFFVMAVQCIKGPFNAHFTALFSRKPLRFDTLPNAPTVNGRSYVSALTAEGEKFASYPIRLGQMWRLIFKSLWVCAGYAWSERRKRNDLRDRFEVLRHPDHWKKAFYAPRD